MKHSTDLSPKRKNWIRFRDRPVLFLSLLLLILTLVSLCFGSYPLRFFGDAAERETAVNVFVRLRLPRVFTGILAGGVLGVTGAVCQTIFCNPLASPDITGVASGASFGAAGAILLGASGFALTGIAFLGGLSALAFLLLLVRLSGFSGTEQRGRYLLAGILVSSAADAGVMILKTASDPERELAAIEFWTMGSLASITDRRFLLMALSSVPPLILLFLFSRQALILSRGREEARAVGLSPARWQMILLLLSTWAVAGVVSTVGVIGFVGLIVPHIALNVTHSRAKPFLPVCFLMGAALTLLSDLLARTVLTGSELPVSIFCVGFAVLWFLWLFCRGKVMGGEPPC